jgi:replication-associated recombination protein RarA
MLNLISETLRPKKFDQLVLEKQLIDKLQKMHDTHNVMNMIFYGKPGSGKTSAARIFVDSAEFDCLQINGSLDTKIETVRTKILNFSTSMSLHCHQKICFIDEADYLSKSAQASLRGVIEDTSRNCRYIFTANDMSKIHPALCSRLMPICFDMTAMQIEEELNRYKKRVAEFMNANSVVIDPLRISRIIDTNFPDYRTIANKLEFELV